MYIIINGGGKIGEYLAIKMLDKGHEVAIIEKREAAARHLAETLPGKQLVICGDGCDSSYQSDAGIVHADVFVATTGQDDDNLVSCEIAHSVFKVKRTIARVNNPKNLRIFKELGIEAVSSTTIISQIIEEEAFADDIALVSTLSKNNLTILEVELAGNQFFSHGRHVRHLTLPAGSLIVAVSHEGEFATVDHDTEVEEGDTIIALVKAGDEDLVRRALHVRE